MPTRFDPQLHILRSVANSVDDNRERHEAASARHKLFEALETENYDSAAQWLEALEIALHSLSTPLDARVMASANKAIALIRKSLPAQKKG